MANVVFYNKDIFEEQGLSVPTTYSEFIETCEALKAAGSTPCAAAVSYTHLDVYKRQGQTMKAMKGKADPAMVNVILKEIL